MHIFALLLVGATLFANAEPFTLVGNEHIPSRPNETTYIDDQQPTPELNQTEVEAWKWHTHCRTNFKPTHKQP